MGMTIDKTISELEDLKKYTFSYMTANQAFTTAIDTLRKYQKIQEVMDSRPDDDAKSNSKALGAIEVIMYGDNN